MSYPCRHWIMTPEAGQGAKKLKSYFPTGGLISTNFGISGLLINNCIPIHAPKDNPQIQYSLDSGFWFWSQSNAIAESASSPSLPSCSPSDLPTPPKIKSQT